MRALGAEATPRCVLARLRDARLRERLSDDGRHRVERLLAVVDGQLPGDREHAVQRLLLKLLHAVGHGQRLREKTSRPPA